MAGAVTAPFHKQHTNSCTWLQVTGALLTGEWPGDGAREALALALGGCAQLDAVMREALREAAAAAVQ